MKITAFNGSPLAEQGHTNIITQDFLIGAFEGGAKVQNIQLAKKQIKLCNGCVTCFYKKPGECELKDDMAELIKKFMGADVVLFAMPVYFDNVTALMKNFIDRLLPLLEPHYEKDLHGKYRRRARFSKYPLLVTIAGCAMPDRDNFQIVSMFFRRMARSLHTQLVGEIYCAAAGLLHLSRRELSFKPAVNRYRNLIRNTGKEFAKNGRISPETTAKLHQPLIDPDEYAKYANKMWDQLLEKHGNLKILT